ncbi:MAG TPA: sterol desaturase family protein [Quisquiliibacterium sp.]|nr:sterol desaturase family protein [Quisquiliibacterium sp.]
MFGWLADAISAAQGWLYETLVQPLLFASGLINFGDQAYDALEWMVIGAIEVAAMAAVLPILERRWAAEPLVDRAAVRTDVLYTLLHRLGAFPLIAFALLTPAFDALESALRLDGFARLEIDRWWPGVTDLPAVSFVIYLVLLDFVDYWMHRGQHRFAWWWALHAVHHSQRQMTFWSDNRNHVLDDLLRDAVLAVVAILVGVAPGQFIGLIVASRVLQSVQHGNLRWRWGGLGERLLVSPSYHRLHHAIGYGHDGPARGCNFAVLFPVWDLLFGTADFRPGFVPTGVRDQLEGRDYGRGFWSQQWLALRRLVGRA